jgi:hypothetical protein
MALVESNFGQTDQALYREGGRRNGGEDGVFRFMAEFRVVVVVEAKTHRPGPFISGQS